MRIVEINGLKFKPLITSERIRARIAEMAAQLNHDLEGTDPLFVCMLNGAAIFAADIMRAMDTSADLAFVKWKSYSGTSSLGVIKEELPLDRDVSGRNVVILEDIVDSGATMYKFTEKLKAQGAASVKLVSFLTKPDSIKYPVNIDYVGFQVGREFVVGNGFDVDGYGRGLDGIYQLITD